MSSNHWEETHKATLFEIKRFLSVPKTVYEIAEEFGWHPQTARRYLWELKTAGEAVALPRKRDRQTLWQAKVGADGVSGEALIVTSGGTYPLKAFTEKHDDIIPASSLIAGALAYVWRRGYYKLLNQDDAKNVARQGSIPPQDVRDYLIGLHKSISALKDGVEFMLFNIPELWQDGTRHLPLYGKELDQEALEEAASWFEVVYDAATGRTGGS